VKKTSLVRKGIAKIGDFLYICFLPLRQPKGKILRETNEGGEVDGENKREKGCRMKGLYFREWEFFREHLENIFVWLVFFSVLMTGLIYFSLLNEPETLTKVLGSIKDALKEKGLLGIIGKSSFWVAYKIFLNNLQATLIFTALGLVPFFVGTVVFVSSVAVLLGATLALTVSKGFEIATFIKLTAPHGVVELFAVFYGASLGVFLSKQITKKLFPKHRESTVPLGFVLKKFIASYALLILPLLALAALIESFVTPLLV